MSVNRIAREREKAAPLSTHVPSVNEWLMRNPIYYLRYPSQSPDFNPKAALYGEVYRTELQEPERGIFTDM